jgi:hypothetical protein
MKKLLLILACSLSCFFISCGSSQEEEAKQKKIDDSLFEKDRDNAIDLANKILLDTAKKDTTAKKKTSKPKSK